MSRWSLRLLLPLLVVPAIGCYGTKLLREPVAVDNTEQRVMALTEQQAMLNAEIKQLQEALARQEEMLRGLRADTQTRLKELGENVETVNSRIGDSLDRRSLFSPSPAASTSPPGYPGAIPQGADSASSSAGLTPAQAKAIYDDAYLDLNRGNYALALVGFQDYLKKSPDSELADNAQYWIGECYYAQRDFRRAIEEFSRVEQTYPKADKVPAALLKIGYSYLQLEDRAAARRILRDLVARFSSTEEAAQGRAKLQMLE
jgi:tol-pal system protein YbgF